MHPLMYRPSLPSQVSLSLTDRMMMQMSWYLTDSDVRSVSMNEIVKFMDLIKS